MTMLCPICAGEFDVLQAPLCPGCGVKLIPESLEQATEVRDAGEFEELCRPQTYSIAMLVKQMLEQNGIAVVVQGGHSMSVLPSLSFLGEMRVLVDKRQMSYAQQLYSAYFESGGSDTYEIEEDSAEDQT